jgi:hypothetical protein
MGHGDQLGPVGHQRREVVQLERQGVVVERPELQHDPEFLQAAHGPMLDS